MKEDKDKASEPAAPVKFERRSTERRAAKIANTKIAQSAKILASNKIIATAGLDTPTPKPRARNKNAANQKGTPPSKPQLVYSPSPPLQKLIPLSSASYSTTPPASKQTVPSLKVSLSVATNQKSAPVLPAKRKSSSGSGSSAKNLGLIMECEDDELSPIQWATYKRAENEYLDVLRKLTRWRSRSDVEIVQIDANDAIPAPPRFLTVTEASRLPLPSQLPGNRHLNFSPEERSASSLTRLVNNSSVSLTSGPGNGLSANQSRVVLTPRSSFIRNNNESRQQVPTATQAPVVDQQQVLQTRSNSSFESSNVAVFKKYPELEVRLSPQKLVTHSFVMMKKEELDKTFKTLMGGGSVTLEKWMLEKGLFGQTRYCLFHSNLQMKLMYMSCLNDDQRKSGYKWWCPTCAVMVPVNQGSFFSKWKQTHSEVLRLVYHWACNTDIVKVIQEYTYNAEFINSVIMALRSICNAQSIHWRLGGHNHSVEIAEMPLGDCQDIENVSAYCAYDRVSRLVLLGACTKPSVPHKLSILFKTFIAKESTIVGERTLIPYLPPHFRQSFVSIPIVGVTTGANLNAYCYLRDHVCAVLRDHVKKLKLYVVQVMLDELAWREKFGQNPHDAFSNILTHIKQAYVSSVVTTKGMNSLPITMASGLKLVDTPSAQPSVVATTAVATPVTSTSSSTLLSPSLCAQLSKTVQVSSQQSFSQPSMLTEPSSSSVEPEIAIEIDEDSSDLLPAAEVIIEEEPFSEESVRTNETDSEISLPLLSSLSAVTTTIAVITTAPVIRMNSTTITTTTTTATTTTTTTTTAAATTTTTTTAAAAAALTIATTTISASAAAAAATTTTTTTAAATAAAATSNKIKLEANKSETASSTPIAIYKSGALMPNTTPVVIIKGSGGELTIVQGSLKKPKPVCQEIKVSDAVPLVGLPLDTYYYATMDGTEPVGQKVEKKKYKFKCPACKKVVEDNIKVMKHLHGHIDDLKQLNLDLSDLTQCKYCFREFASPYAMQSHVEDVHVSEPVTPICRICNKEFFKKMELLRHMQSSHTQSEMPYTCFVCKYRTSFYRDAINHFQQVHGHTNKLQCHYCLQVFSVRFGHGIQEGVTYSFYRHLYKHQTKSHSRRCQNCCLTFLSLSELQHHRLTDHISYKNREGIKPVKVENRSKAIMIDPDLMKKVLVKNALGVKDNLHKSPEFKCIECKTSLYRQNHFIQNMSCSLCSFITTCSRAFADHAIGVHSVPPRAVPKPFRRLASSVCCLCGFHTYYGDKMARHLSKCSRTWCYFEEDLSSDACRDANELKDVLEHLTANVQKEIAVSEVEPMEITQPEPTSSSSDNDDKHNMLNVLGLMRVPSQKRITYSRKNVIAARNSNRPKVSDDTRTSNIENASTL